ncbi:MAG TPA: helix-turn-helix transcriptional regulator [Chitinophagaceae bacterium]|nr:helix-turn-helix transcriptional regulator [Chitinophagaceae bacterium]
MNNSNSDREKIAARLKEARILAGLSQAHAADKLGLQRPAISEIEAGKRKVSAEEIIQFANLYKVDTSWLLLKENDAQITEEFKFAARELGKLSKKDIEKVLHVLKILPK